MMGSWGFLLGMTAFLLGTNSVAVERYLVCKGGPGMSANFYSYMSNGDLGVELNAKFKRGKTAGQPKPGECVWRFAAMKDTDPGEFLYSVMTPNSQHFTVNHLGIFLGEGPALQVLYSIRNQKEIYFMVEMNNPTVLGIIRVGWQ